MINFITPYSVKVGVLGAGTMGSGIALALLYADIPVTLYDVSVDMLSSGKGYIEKHLARKGKESNVKQLELATDLEVFQGAGILIEAIPENLALKEDLFSRLDRICPPPAILATNTSTLSVTAIAAATNSPERVAGMHFFNPAPVLPLVEVIRGARTSQATLDALVALAKKMGKTPIVAGDNPGFVVNRVARPFYGEALRLFGEQTASHDQIDLVVCLGGGFRMGPFELMDLIGIDINLAAMQSMYKQTFGEARYRPHPIQLRMVAQKSLGRKTGSGFYQYDTAPSSTQPQPPQISKRNGQVLLSAGSWAPGIADLARRAGYTILNGVYSTSAELHIAVITAGRSESLEKLVKEIDLELPPEVPILSQCVDIPLTEIATWMRNPERLAGFDGLFFTNGPAATLVPSPLMHQQIRARVEAFISSLGRLAVWIEDSPALVLPRIVAMLANEAAFAVQEGVAEPDQIDLAMQLGVSYPKGPLTWAKQIGYARIVDILDHLHAEYLEERYRACNLLRRWNRLQMISA